MSNSTKLKITKSIWPPLNPTNWLSCERKDFGPKATPKSGLLSGIPQLTPDSIKVVMFEYFFLFSLM